MGGNTKKRIWCLGTGPGPLWTGDPPDLILRAQGSAASGEWMTALLSCLSVILSLVVAAAAAPWFTVLVILAVVVLVMALLWGRPLWRFVGEWGRPLRRFIAEYIACHEPCDEYDDEYDDCVMNMMIV